jgi:hypothetical protein
MPTMQLCPISIGTIARTRLAFALVLFCAFAFAQQPIAPEPPKPSALSPHARLMSARSIYIEHAGGRLPNDVIGDAFQGWGRYIVVPEPAQADLIISINAPVSDAGVSVSGGDGRHGSPTGGSRVISSSNVIQIRLTILDAHDRVVLWGGSEQPKSSLKEKQREDNIVDASLRLFRRFRDTIEPEPAP